VREHDHDPAPGGLRVERATAASQATAGKEEGS
jgi:hypothetical protein